MPRKRFENLDADRQRLILAAAADEFADHGFQNASLNRISSEAGISKGSIYYYFEDKADLYAAVISRAWQAILPREPLEIAKLNGQNFWPEIEDRYFRMIEKSRNEEWLPAAGKLIYHLAPVASADELVTRHFRQARVFLRNLLRHGQRLQVVRDDLPEGLLLELITNASETADRWFVDHWEDLKPEEMDLLAPRIFEMLRGMVVPRSEEF